MIEVNNISYRDSAARVVKKDNGYNRYVFLEYKDEYDYLINSGLYNELTKKDLLIKHQEVIIDIQDTTVYKQLFPEQILFQSYPFEWCFSQWRKAIIAFLKINIISLKYGMILKDATPYNFYFLGGKAVMLDTSSFIFYKEDDKWLAYRQFCEEFLGPFTLMHYNGAQWAKLSMSSLRGISLPFISKNLPLKSWLNLSTLINIHIHAKYIYTKSKTDQLNKKGLNVEKMKALFKLTLSNINKWKKPYQYKDNWASYYEQDIETKEYLENKENTIEKWLSTTKPKSVVDIGANIGKFSFIAAKYTNYVIAMENDHDCVEKIDTTITNKSIPKIFPLVSNIVETSPSLGYLNEEFTSLLVRVKSEMILALAISHHLFITYSLSFTKIFELLKKITQRYIIVEYIPDTDRKVIELKKTSKRKLDNYSQIDFETSISNDFLIIDKKHLNSSERILYLIELKRK